MDAVDILGKKTVVEVLAYMVEHPQPMRKKDFELMGVTSTSTAARAIDALAEAGLVEPIGEGLYPKYHPVTSSEFVRRFKGLIDSAKEGRLSPEDKTLRLAERFREKGVDVVFVGPFLTKLYGFRRHDVKVFVFGGRKSDGVDFVREYPLFHRKRAYGDVQVPEREDAILAYSYLVKKGLLPLDDLLSILLREQATDWTYVIEMAQKWGVKEFLVRIISGLRGYAPHLPDLTYISTGKMEFPPELVKSIKEKLGVLSGH